MATHNLHTPTNTDWQHFVIENGWRAPIHALAAVVGQPMAEVMRFRNTGVCKCLAVAKGFVELFSLWYGRPPRDNEWPIPRKGPQRGTYEWQGPELALLASLVGRLGCAEIAQVLTKRLRDITGDPNATRSRYSVLVRTNHIGLQTKDVLGGISTAEAVREVGSVAIINHAIRKKQLRTHRVGRLHVIPHDAWAAWKAKRVFPPPGYVLLSSIREALGIRSDKLSEWARAGYVPTAMRCNPCGAPGLSSRFGSWYIDPKVAEKLLADRRAGRAMPWHGKPMHDNLSVTFRLWKRRKHPTSCKTCAEIWGRLGAPRSYEDYAVRYPPLPHGAKRHLTRPWSPGLTKREVAMYAGCSESLVARAVENGMLGVSRAGRFRYVSRTDAARWKARRCPTGDNDKSWVSLRTASKQYLFTQRELQKFIADKKLKSKAGTLGAMRGVVHVCRFQCSQLREQTGFTEEQAAKRAGVTVPKLRLLLKGVDWRKANGIPLVTVQAVIKRLESKNGYTIQEAAAVVGMPVEWVIARRNDGTIKVTSTKWDGRHVYITEPMLERLKAAKRKPLKRERFNADWLRLSRAAFEAGVSAGTIIRWAEDGDLDRRRSRDGWRYHREAVRARARRYWKSVRLHRATPPEWLQAETAMADSSRSHGLNLPTRENYAIQSIGI